MKLWTITSDTDSGLNTSVHVTEQDAYDTLANTLTQVFGVSWEDKSVEAIKSLYEQLSEEGRFGIDSYQVTEHEVAEPPITGVYLNKEATVIVADIDKRELSAELQDFLKANIVFRDEVLQEHIVGCSEFEAEEGYDDLSESSKEVLATIQTEAGKLGAAYIRLVHY
jgi:hypothetical protein